MADLSVRGAYDERFVSGDVREPGPGPGIPSFFFGMSDSEQPANHDTKQRTERNSQPAIQVGLPPHHRPQHTIVHDLLGFHNGAQLPLPDLVMHDTGAQQFQHTTTSTRPLNVTDALTYLDAVKNQFGDQPEVYNKFLDIMKDFKSQNIDTPGVIQRVSKLFHGNPPLIQGFNTFLPAGYRIDTSADPLDNTITVTTPSGTTIHDTGSSTIIRPPRDELSGPGTMYPPPPHLAGPGGGPGSRAMTPHGYPHTVAPPSHPHHLHLPPPGPSQFIDPGIYSPGIPGQSHAAAFLMHNKNSPNGPNGGGPTQEGKAESFNIAPAIQYLNKIKSRYAEDQNTYKQFLDILQAYQKEQRPLPESQVYEQVQMLFKDAPDLIAEFKAFLPEAVGSGGGLLDHGGIIMGPQAVGPPLDVWGQREPEQRHPSPPLAAASKKQPAANKSRRKRPLEKETTPVPVAPPKASSSRQAKKLKHHHNADTGSPSFSPYPTPRSPPPQPQVYHTNAATIVQHGHPMPHAPPPNSATSADKLLFFDRAKKSLESREVYEEFLKLLSLFSKEIIDGKGLIERAKVFLQDENLMQEFKTLIGWDERMEDLVENGPPGSIRTAAPEVPQPVDDGEGPSYRKLPDSEIRLACSGRDELCRSVLNDVWVSHPTWASEESGFVAHKKNTYEEALHKSEEERHEYHVHIEALTRTIAVLEPLCSRIEEMPPEERAAFKLAPDFGGTAKAIYHRTIRRIYGRDNGNEVIQALQDCPSIAVPVVLTRLKTRDEEWKRAQREFSRSWRDVDGRNFYKSLDHQGIYWKANDKKNITTKYFCGEIESTKNDQLNVQEADSVLQWRHPLDHQLEFTFSDTPVLLDSLKLIYSFMDRSQVQYSPLERRAVDKFLRAFIPCLFNYPDLDGGPTEAGAENGGGVVADEEAAAMHEIMMLNGGAQSADGPRTGRKSSGGTPHSTQSNGVPANDLRKKLLKTAQEKASASSKKDGSASAPTAGSSSRGPNSAADSRAGTPLPESSSRFLETDDNGQAIPDVWIRETDHPSDSAATEQSNADRPLFINTTFYTLLRLLQLLYWRLQQCKQIGAELAAQKHAPLLANPIADELGLVDAHGPPFILQQTIEAMGERGTAEGANPCYAYLLNAAERWFENELDPLVFEEHMRWFFGTKAYHLFTIDKVIMSLIKQVQTILSDGRCQELWSLFQTAQTSEKITHQDIIRYRRNAEKHVGSGHDDHLFRIQWNRGRKCIRVSLMEKDDTTIPSDGRPMTRWREYLNSYVMSYPTEWLPPPRPSSGPVYLKRALQSEEATASTVIRDDQTKIRVGLPSYKLIYESGCEDFIWRKWGAEEGAVLRSRERALHEERRKCRLLLC